MRPVRLPPQTAAGPGPVVVPDFRGSNFAVSLALIFAAGTTATAKVQFTTDDVLSPSFNSATATWFDHATLVGITANAVGNIAFPVTGIRLNLTAYTAGSVQLNVTEASGFVA